MGLKDFFKRSKLKLKEEDIVEAGACPNCWGVQEWEDQFIQLEKDRDRDIINKDHSAQKAFVQHFIEERVTGIRLKSQGERLVCQKCQSGYRHKSSHIN